MQLCNPPPLVSPPPSFSGSSRPAGRGPKSCQGANHAWMEKIQHLVITPPPFPIWPGIIFQRAPDLLFNEIHIIFRRAPDFLFFTRLPALRFIAIIVPNSGIRRTQLPNKISGQFDLLIILPFWLNFFVY